MRNSWEILQDVCKGNDLKEAWRQDFEPSRNLMLDIILESDKAKEVKEWIFVDNPVVGTCRHCGKRDFVDRPRIGLY